MAIEYKNFIHVYENSLPRDICTKLIEIFEEHKNKHERYDQNRTPNFTQFNFTKNINISSEIQTIHQVLISKTLQYKTKYYKWFGEKFFPNNNVFEQFRIKKYNNDGNDAFDLHVDVLNMETSKRFLSFFWYLNDVDEGGETAFGDFLIKPTAGKLVIFPPLWMFPHQGNPPISNEKYLLSTYLHYI